NFFASRPAISVSKKNFQKFFWAIQNLKILKVSNLPRQSPGVLNPDLKINEERLEGEYRTSV
ncbi:MAG: hypothetical protein Q8N99_00010, partial [Nanoarchaeota archaeon]|nr:hypothetical protein [Nanoarchaeota archaeon]